MSPSVHAPRRALALAAGVLATALAYPAGDADDEVAAADAHPALDHAQEQAGGLEVARPQPARATEREAALGLVLDPGELRADLDALHVATVAEHAAQVELDRLRELHAAGAQASLRMVEAAGTEHSKLRAERRAAQARLLMRWGPVASLAADAQASLAERVVRGAALLVRADLPGRHSLGALPASALLEVDGLEVPGKVLGALRASDEVQSAALLLEVARAPVGLGAGARLPVVLIGAARSGLAVPREAVLYDEHGAYVYKRIAAAGPATAPGPKSKARYVPVPVQLLAPLGSGWLVAGIDDDDDIVVAGAGVLWSLEGVGALPQEADED